MRLLAAPLRAPLAPETPLLPCCSYLERLFAAPWRVPLPAPCPAPLALTPFSLLVCFHVAKKSVPRQTQLAPTPSSLSSCYEERHLAAPCLALLSPTPSSFLCCSYSE